MVLVVLYYYCNYRIIKRKNVLGEKRRIFKNILECEIVDKTKEGNVKYYTILDKIKIIYSKYPKLKNMRVSTIFPYEIINIVHFIKFSQKEVSDWWKDYNLVKHDRAVLCEGRMYNYQRANLKNVLNALAALYILCLKIYSELDINDEEKELIEPESKLFEREISM